MISLTAGKDVSKLDDSYRDGLSVKWHSNLGNRVWQLLLKLKIIKQIDYSGVALLDLSQRYMQKTCTWTFKEVLFIIAQNRKLFKYSSVDEQFNTLWYLHFMEFSTAIEKSKQLIHTKNLDDFQENYTEWKKPITK